MATGSPLRTGLLRAFPFAALLLIASPGSGAARTSPSPHLSVPATARLAAAPAPRQITITYTTHDGHERNAYVLLPHDYRRGANPAIPLVISPHGRAVDGKINTRRWGKLPTV